MRQAAAGAARSRRCRRSSSARVSPWRATSEPAQRNVAAGAGPLRCPGFFAVRLAAPAGDRHLFCVTSRTFFLLLVGQLMLSQLDDRMCTPGVSTRSRSVLAVAPHLFPGAAARHGSKGAAPHCCAIIVGQGEGWCTQPVTGSTGAAGRCATAAHGAPTARRPPRSDVTTRSTRLRHHRGAVWLSSALLPAPAPGLPGLPGPRPRGSRCRAGSRRGTIGGGLIGLRGLAGLRGALLPLLIWSATPRPRSRCARARSIAGSGTTSASFAAASLLRARRSSRSSARTSLNEDGASPSRRRPIQRGVHASPGRAVTATHHGSRRSADPSRLLHLPLAAPPWADGPDR